MAVGRIAGAAMLLLTLAAVGCAKKPAEEASSAVDSGAAPGPSDTENAKNNTAAGAGNGQMPDAPTAAAAGSGTAANSSGQPSVSEDSSASKTRGAEQSTAGDTEQAAAAKFQPTQLIELMMRPVSGAMQAGMQTMMQSAQGAMQGGSSSSGTNETPAADATETEESAAEASNDASQ